MENDKNHSLGTEEEFERDRIRNIRIGLKFMGIIFIIIGGVIILSGLYTIEVNSHAIEGLLLINAGIGLLIMGNTCFVGSGIVKAIKLAKTA
jgi:hypothetical protein